MPPICRHSSVRSHPPRPIPFSFPVMACAVETISIWSRRAGTAAFVVAAVATLTTLINQTARSEPTAPALSARDESVAEPFAGFVAEAEERFGIPASWIRAVMRIESAGDMRALSPKGAMGLMQLMPETWATLRSKYSLGADPYDPRDNILAGAAYLRELYDRYGSAGFLAAYNAGPARYEDHLATGRLLPAETVAYVAMLAPLIGDHAVDGAMTVAAVARSWTEAPLFARQPVSSSSQFPPSADPSAERASSAGIATDLTALTPQSAGLFVRISQGRQVR
jgi:hypothetical protein